MELHFADCEIFIAKIKEIYGNKYPIFLSGISLGGLTAYTIALRKPDTYKGVILFAPAIKYNPNIVSSFALSALNMFSNVIPRVPLILPSKGKINKNPLVSELNGSNEFIFTDASKPRTL